MHEITDSQSISLSSEVRYRAVGDEGVLVNIENGRVLVVNGVGLHIVEQLKESTTRCDLTASIVDVFDVTREQAAADIDFFLVELDQDQILDRH